MCSNSTEVAFVTLLRAVSLEWHNVRANHTPANNFTLSQHCYNVPFLVVTTLQNYFIAT